MKQKICFIVVSSLALAMVFAFFQKKEKITVEKGLPKTELIVPKNLPPAPPVVDPRIALAQPLNEGPPEIQTAEKKENAGSLPDVKGVLSQPMNEGAKLVQPAGSSSPPPPVPSF